MSDKYLLYYVMFQQQVLPFRECFLSSWCLAHTLFLILNLVKQVLVASFHNKERLTYPSLHSQRAVNFGFNLGQLNFKTITLSHLSTNQNLGNAVGMSSRCSTVVVQILFSPDCLYHCTYYLCLYYENALFAGDKDLQGVAKCSKQKRRKPS